MEEKRFMTFQEKVEPLSKNEEGQLMGGFASVELPDELARAGLVNGKDCTNYDCPEDSKNKERCENDNCRICSCGGDSGGKLPGNFPCTSIGPIG